MLVGKGRKKGRVFDMGIFLDLGELQLEIEKVNRCTTKNKVVSRGPH